MDVQSILTGALGTLLVAAVIGLLKLWTIVVALRVEVSSMQTCVAGKAARAVCVSDMGQHLEKMSSLDARLKRIEDLLDRGARGNGRSS